MLRMAGGGVPGGVKVLDGRTYSLDAAGAVGKGGASAGKNVAVGTAKGTGKIGKGIGKAIKKPF
jgi:hypothetical protein